MRNLRLAKVNNTKFQSCVYSRLIKKKHLVFLLEMIELLSQQFVVKTDRAVPRIFCLWGQTPHTPHRGLPYVDRVSS